MTETTEKLEEVNVAKAIIDGIVSHYDIKNKAQLANTLGISRGALNNKIESGSFKISFVQLLFEKFPDINPRFLLTGEGSPGLESAYPGEDISEKVKLIEIRKITSELEIIESQIKGLELSRDLLKKKLKDLTAE